MTVQSLKDSRSKWLALAVLALAQFMVVLDVTIVNVALPAIQADLGFSAEGLQWVVNAYTLTFGGLLLLGGRMSDILGRRRVFLMGLGLFAAASLAGGFATSGAMLVAVRAIQGIGAALLSPAALALLTVTFAAGRERNVALGVWGALAGIGGTLGVVAGGVLVDAAGWQWIFFVNVPFAILALLATPRIVAESRRAAGHRHEHVRAHRPGPLRGGGELGDDDREDHGGLGGRARALEQARGDHGALRGREPAEQRRQREGDHAREEHPLAADQVAEPAGQEQQAAEGDEERVDHPGEVRLAEAEIGLDRGQRDVHDRDVEDDHQLGEADDGEGRPAAAIGGGAGDRGGEKLQLDPLLSFAGIRSKMEAASEITGGCLQNYTEGASGCQPNSSWPPQTPPPRPC